MVEALAQGELRQVKLSQQDRPGLFQLRNHHGVLVWYVVPLQRRAVGGADAGGIELVFHRYRYAVQWAPVPPAGDFLLCGTRRLPGLLVAHGDVRVDPPVDPVDALQVRCGCLHRRDLSCLDQPPQLGDGKKG